MYSFLILTDIRGWLARSLVSHRGCVNVDVLAKHLRNIGCRVEIRRFCDITFPTAYSGWYVVYPSSEDPGLFYKSYIDDVIYQLKVDGAILLPKYELFKAHHNKVFMENYRTRLTEEYNSIHSLHFCGIEDFKNKVEAGLIKFPAVIKRSAGAGSSGITLVHNEQEAKRFIMRSGRYEFYNNVFTRKYLVRIKCWELVNRLKTNPQIEGVRQTEKMVAQNLINGLECDYKVLVFGKKYYILRRGIKKGDFRASGSGLLEFPEEITNIEEAVLSFAKGAYEQLDAPLLSIDIAYDGKKCHMIEFQCLNFGPYTLEMSEKYYQYDESPGGWRSSIGFSVLEKEMANSFVQYVEEYENG